MATLPDRVQARFDQSMGYRAEDSSITRAGKTNCVAQLLFATLFVMGCVAAGGGLSATAIGWSAVGISASTLVLQVAGGNWKNRKIDLITTALFVTALITIGVLGGMGLLSAAQIGGSILGILGAHFLFYCCIYRGYMAHQEKLNGQAL